METLPALSVHKKLIAHKVFWMKRERAVCVKFNLSSKISISPNKLRNGRLKRTVITGSNFFKRRYIITFHITE